jgi:uncharacterized protein (DUF1800 family)
MPPMPVIDETSAAVAHVLRRCTFGPFPWQVEDLIGRGLDAPAVIQLLLDAPPLSPAPPDLSTDRAWEEIRFWWPRVMGSWDAGLHEKMTWFWHGHLTSSLSKAGKPDFLWRQHLILREHAMGDLRALLKAITVDGAMLIWLDGAGSNAAEPNENYARELMELFTLGRGTYTHDDIRAAATALAGWVVDWESTDTWFEPEQGPTAPVWFLDREVMSADEVVDAVCDHPACAPFIAGKLHRFLLGVDPDDARRAELGEVFRASGLQIRALVEAIVWHPSFMEARFTRPRFPVEWIVATSAVMGTELNAWMLDLLGQAPFDPPNVAGWPVSPKWLSVGSALVRAQSARDHAWDTEVIEADDPVLAILQRASLYEVSDTTLSALHRAAGRVEGRRERASLLHALVVACPEFALA